MNGQELTAAYVLGELDGRELVDFERRLDAEPGLRAEVEAARGTIAQLEALPGHAWPGEEPTAAAIPRSIRRHRSLTLRPALATALIAAVFIVGGVAGALIFSGSGSSSTAPVKTVLVLHPLDAPKRSRADLSMPDAHTMLLRTHDLPASPAGSYYEVWLMSSAEKLVPVASFRVGKTGNASVEVPLPASPADYRYFDVSRQTVAGGTAHSSDSVLRGSTSALS